MASSERPPAEVPGNLEASAIVARFRALIDAGCANTHHRWIRSERQRRGQSEQEGWGKSQQEVDTDTFRQEMVRTASPMVVRQALEKLLHDYPTLLYERVEADYIPWPWGWRAVVWRALAENYWTVADAIVFARSFLATEKEPLSLYWEAKEAIVFLADFYKESHEVVAFLLEAREFSDFDYVVDALIRERFSPTEVWTPALSIALRGHPEMKSFLLTRLAPLLRTHGNIRIIVEDALRADPLKFSLNAWRAYAAGAPEDQAFRAGMDEIVETLVAATASRPPAYNFVPFDLYMRLYPADETALRHCMRAVFEGSASLRLLAVDWLGKRFWRFEQTKSALLRVMHESSEPAARSQAFYALILRYGTDPDLRASIFQAAAAESMPEPRQAMMRSLGGEPIQPIAPRSETEKKCERRLFKSVYALVQADAICFLPADFLRHRVVVLAAKLAYLKPSISLADLRRKAGHDDSEYHDLLTQRDQAEREKAQFEYALLRVAGSARPAGTS
jgi:hypothetical protein